MVVILLVGIGEYNGEVVCYATEMKLPRRGRAEIERYSILELTGEGFEYFR